MSVVDPALRAQLLPALGEVDKKLSIENKNSEVNQNPLRLTRLERCRGCFRSAWGGMRSRAGRVYVKAKEILNTKKAACGMMAVGASGVAHCYYTGGYSTEYYASISLLALGFQSLCMNPHPTGAAESIRHLTRRVLRRENAVLSPQESSIGRERVNCCVAVFEISTGTFLIVQRDLGHVINRLVVSLDTVNELAFYSMGASILAMYVRMRMKRAVEGSEKEEIEKMKSYYEKCQKEWIQATNCARACQMVAIIALNILIVGAGLAPLIMQEKLQKTVDETSSKVLIDLGLVFASLPLGFYSLQMLDKRLISAHIRHNKYQIKIIDFFKFLLESPALPIGLGFFLYKSEKSLARNLSALMLWGITIGANHRLLLRSYLLKLFDLSNKEKLGCGWTFFKFMVYVAPWPLLGWFAYQDAKAPIKEDRMPYQGFLAISILTTTCFTLCLLRYCVSLAHKHKKDCFIGRNIIKLMDFMQLGMIVLSLYVKFFVPKENKITTMGIIDLAAVWSSVAISLSNAIVGAFFKHSPDMANTRVLHHLPILL